MSLICSLAEARRFIFTVDDSRDKSLSFEIARAGCRFYLSHLPFHLKGSKGVGEKDGYRGHNSMVKQE